MLRRAIHLVNIRNMRGSRDVREELRILRKRGRLNSLRKLKSGCRGKQTGIKKRRES